MEEFRDAFRSGEILNIKGVLPKWRTTGQPGSSRFAIRAAPGQAAPGYNRKPLVFSALYAGPSDEGPVVWATAIF